MPLKDVEKQLRNICLAKRLQIYLIISYVIFFLLIPHNMSIFASNFK